MTIFRRAISPLFALLLAASASAAPRRPLNPRQRGKSAGKSVAKKPEAPRLLAGRWTKEIDRAVRELVEVRGSSAAAYDQENPPLAALAFDGAAYSAGDSAAAVFRRLVDESEFRYSEEFWKQVPLGSGRQKIRAAYEQFSLIPKQLWPSQPTYRQFRKYFFASYLDICANVGRKECRAYLARLLIGFTDEELREYAKNALDEEAKEKPRLEAVGLDDTDPAPVMWQRGLAASPEFAALVSALRANGFDVWALGAQSEQVLMEAATRFGVDQSRCLGIRHFHERDKLNGQLREPIPVRSGSLDAFLKARARAPALVLGARREDFELLGYAQGLRLFLDDGDASVASRAKAQGALLQPYFEVVKPNP